MKRLGSWLDAHGYTTVFVDDRELRPINEYDRDVHWLKREIENFIAIHRSRPDVLERLTQRIANRKPAR